MLGTSAVKQYFSTGSSHYLTPAISAEWNYNLFYEPHITFSGDGTKFAFDGTGGTKNWKTAANWSCTSGVTALYAKDDVNRYGMGKVTTSYPILNLLGSKAAVANLPSSGNTLNDEWFVNADNTFYIWNGSSWTKDIPTTRPCLQFTSTATSGTATINVPISGGANDTYKIVFYAKVKETGDATNPSPSVYLTALTYIDYHRTNSSAHVVDSALWTKYEVYVSSRPQDTTYSSFDLKLGFASEDSVSQSYTILIDQVEMYKTSSYEYQYGNLWQTKSVFGAFRPGESYVPSGNALTPLPADFRKIKGATNLQDKYMPCSPVSYHPTLISKPTDIPGFKNGMISDYSVYRYFVSDLNNQKIGAKYDQILATNKIVIKFSLAYSKPAQLSLTLRNTVTSTYYQKTLIAADISDAGVCILYLQSDGSWSTTPWTVMPTFDLSGNITRYQSINEITITQQSSNLIKSGVTSNTNLQNEMKRLQIIELSPRLELDLSSFAMETDTTVELDNKSNPLPISAISSNSATITLSNIPFVVSNHVLSLFSNNSSTSPLKGLFKKNVKFYINYLIRDNVENAQAKDKVIPGGVYYADSWDGQDIQKTRVQLYDITKYLHLLSPTDYVSYSQDVFTVISNILDFAGFTDYDYDDLRRITQDKYKLIDGTNTVNSHPISMRYFFVDGQNQKVFDVLKEIFEVYQIGAYVDAYGVLKFINLEQILQYTKPDMLLHDNPMPQDIAVPIYEQDLTVTSNIVQDTYTETVKVKLGKATLKYKSPQVNTWFPASGSSTLQSVETSRVTVSHVLWNLEQEEVVPFNLLFNDMLIEHNSLQIDPSETDTNSSSKRLFRQYPIDHVGYCLIEGEIVNFTDKQYCVEAYSGPNLNGTMKKYFYNISNSTDLERATHEASGIVGLNGSYKYYPTGVIANIQRGLFNTPVRDHLVINNLTNLNKKLVKQSGKDAAIDTANGSIVLSASNNNFTEYAAANNGIEEVSNTINGYNTFSTKMLIGVNSGNNKLDGFESGMTIGIGTQQAIHISLTQDTAKQYKDRNGIIMSGFSLRVYKYGTDGLPITLLNNNVQKVDITEAIFNQSAQYPPKSPFEDFGKYVNLKFVKISNTTYEIYINKNKINIDAIHITDINSNILNTSGKFGIFVRGATGSVAFTELYACQSRLNNPNTYYHYEEQGFADTILNGKNLFEMNYMMQAQPQIVGINYYDVKNDLANSSALTAIPLKVKYNWDYLDDPSLTYKAGLNPPYKTMKVYENSLNYSTIHYSGARAKFAIINSSPGMVYIKHASDYTNPFNIEFNISTKNMISLGNETVIEKIFDYTNISESIEISSNWVQTKKAANNILKTIFKAIDGFSRDTQISIYGNPLFEIGDVVHIQYSLKNIGENETSSNRYFVQGISQTFQEGLKTVLTLNQIA
jgi:hypothetical protein